MARTERSIVTWCQPNPQGVARLDAYYDMNDRRWFITPESVERAIAEEKDKAARRLDPHPSEAFIPNPSEAGKQAKPDPTGDSKDRIEQLETEVMDLKILNKGKDYVIDQLRNERDGFIHQLVEGSRRIGQLENELTKLAAPRSAATPEFSNDAPGIAPHHDGEGVISYQ